ncbi:hypothetical protein DOTSEDRAFT_75014 [Dothistroma septosporum NZE10]|uniref:Eisosome protein 1 n=1 Tax=Dothistroma septosporum (strain NZE10 / CBS 128990) TaxID=675120 RepID=M2Y1C6_DOTSN|nr:hypothetical protein DOTSEDRAFT_75014 [Dothistroma septosporum NZE10]
MASASASETPSVGPGEMACPDPSVHQHQHKLSEQASTAALYVTNPARQHQAGRDSRSENPLGPDGKLSSKSAATSLRYAKPQDLPSFPSTGGLTADNAGKAALLAKDYKMKELWQPEQSLAGSKAALLAQKKGGKLDLWEASQSKEGLSAAKLAAGSKTTINAYGGVDAESKSKALLAATMSVNKGRSRATSTPQPVHPEYPDSQNATANALGAATASHRASKLGPAGWDAQSNQAARIGNLHKPVRGQFTDNVDYDLDPDDTKHQAALKASAVSMAKGIYQNQNRSKLTDESSNVDLAGAQAAAGRSATSTAAPPDLKQQAMQYISLQDAAHKLAAERLAKIDKDAENARFREYYGYGDDKSKRLSSRMSMRSAGTGRQRKRASSDLGRNYSDDSDDEVQAQRIRTQMAQLSTATGKVDQRKQQDDRAKLMAAAEKRVSARMHTMDEKVLADTGKVPPSLMEDWEAKARERAQKQREDAVQHPGKTHVGGGKFMADADIEAIAAARLKPTLDQLNANAENRRARDEEIRLEREEQEKEKRDEKQKSREEKERVKRIVAEEKASEKARKDEEKARKAEEKRIEKEDKQKSREQKRDTVVVAPTSLDATRADDDENAVEDPAVTKHRSALGRLKERFSKTNKEGEPADNEIGRAETAEVKEERPATAASITAVSGGIPGSTTSGGTATDDGVSPISPADETSVVQPQPIRPHQTERSAVLDHEDPPVPAAMPIASLTVPEHDAPLTAQNTTSDEGTSNGVDRFHPTGVPSVAGVTAAAVPALALNGNEGDVDTSQPASTRPGFGEIGQLSYQEETDAAHLDSRMPDLERHISAIPDSDDSDDEWDSDDERPPRTTGTAAVPSTQAGVAEHDLSKAAIGAGVGAGAGVATGEIGRDSAKAIADRVQAAPVTDETTHSLVSPVEPSVERAVEPTSTVIRSPTTTTTTTTTTTHHQESSAKPAAQNDTAVTTSTDPAETAQSKTSIDEAVAHVANTKFGAVDDKPSATALGTAVSGQPKEAVGPDPKPAKLQKSGGPVEGVGTTVNPSIDAGKLQKDQKQSAAKQEKDGKGFRGFFNKLRNKESKGENKYPDFKSPERGSSKHVSYDSTKAGEKPITTGTTSGIIDTGAEGASATKTADAAPTLANVDTGPTFSPANEPDSPSSFKRGATGLADLDDDSSGAEEEDITRGRTGRSAAGKMGFGSSRTTAKDAAPTDRQNSSTEDETFEEARDHFDESLAPPPAFAGQAKSESPSRGTKFQEQL